MAKVILDHASEIEKMLCKWWKLINFVYSPQASMILSFVLTVVRAGEIIQAFPIVTVGLRKNRAIIVPKMDQVWAIF